MYPFVASGGLGESGVYVGPSRQGGVPFVYDPFLLYPQVIKNPNALLVGPQGFGKSSSAKTVWGLWQLLRGRRVFVLSPKPGDWDRPAAAAGTRPITLRPGGGVRLNVLTTNGTAFHERLEALRTVAAARLRRPLNTLEEAGTVAALQAVESERGEPTIPRVVAALLGPSRRPLEVVGRWQPGPSPLERVDRAEVREMAKGLEELCDGELAGLFDGPTSPGIDLDGPMVVLDIGSLFESSGLSIAMICAGAWLRAAAAAGRGQRIAIFDEAWRAFEMSADMIQMSTKTSRRGVANVFLVHRVSDLAAAGDVGSRTRAVAEGVLLDTDTKVVFGTAETEETARVLELTDTQREWLGNLGPYEALWLVGKRAFVVEHDLGAAFRDLVDTDEGMRA